MPVDSTPKYIPSLDGLRAAAILMVIYSHLSVTHVLPHAIRASTLGNSGVIVFFVLSGFLITLQLESDLLRFGRIRLWRFYIRRIFRLVPALLAMLAGAAVLWRLGLVPLGLADIVHGITYTSDYYHPKYWTLAHLWSLAVEEQFYLVWPVLLIVAGIRKSKLFIAIAIVLCPILRLLAWQSGMDEGDVFRRFELVADSLAFGCFLALDRERILRSSFWTRWRPSRIVAACFAVILVWSVVHRIWPASEIIGRSFTSLATFLLIGAVTFFPASKGAVILSLPPLVWIGRISYSLYLWQQVFLVNTPGVSATPLPFPASLLASFVLASLSYYLLELPLREYGRRLAGAAPGVSRRPAGEEARLKAEEMRA